MNLQVLAKSLVEVEADALVVGVAADAFSATPTPSKSAAKKASAI